MSLYKHFILDHNCQLQMPIFWEWNRKTFPRNFATGYKIWKRYFSSNENWNNFCPSYDSHSVFLNMSETSWHLLTLGTWNSIDIFPKLMLCNACFLTDCFLQGSNKNTDASSVCDIQELDFKLHISATNVRWTYFFFNDSAQSFCHPVHQR